ncbi:universal stress protein [Aquibacillus koreensis]|uniref:Universal stress protein n=1 Tax=Aquibacillus koreensis TaxID=279446 RepID=A0A9X3WNB1_9BACI|nr:universal stress protein [Aquibacillus koreensis]MCT2535993.1 universal stress protein [Aquibacillus koreensis]MDC3420449.1 universal stress protein [Aquibacillus koreensis]
MYNKILLAADGSQHSIRSAEHAIKLAQMFQGTIDVVYVVDSQKSKEDVLHSVDKYEVERERKGKIKPVKDLLEESGIDYNVHILHGEAGPKIVKFANDEKFDCVVVGSRGLNKLQDMILGSVSHKVAKRVECPVLIVK